MVRHFSSAIMKLPNFWSFSDNRYHMLQMDEAFDFTGKLAEKDNGEEGWGPKYENTSVQQLPSF